MNVGTEGRAGSDRTLAVGSKTNHDCAHGGGGMRVRTGHQRLVISGLRRAHTSQR